MDSEIIKVNMEDGRWKMEDGRWGEEEEEEEEEEVVYV